MGKVRLELACCGRGRKDAEGEVSVEVVVARITDDGEIVESTEGKWTDGDDWAAANDENNEIIERT